jgi:hypothetical protein
MDNETKILSGALVLMLLAFPLTSIGTEDDLTALWVAGLVVLGIGAAAAPILRYLSLGDAGADATDDEAAAREDQ